ncbi:flagellar motor switch phosphatase FliY [Aquibacillus salsiterrae]|uniref:Flagellar motor switch phosphatase FliY n=1 Tax=Aquibacillus salsiterrae TaxID=2950439 RepID=A0A9X3WDY1_9BACI|nr:flagellar motor switch phosphatase FliY [Aquibacillus salsiterrae]MDC3416385.1 flagellar motor switch phosphatase FliY [Aquibacillus salsiterrae]
MMNDGMLSQDEIDALLRSTDESIIDAEREESKDIHPPVESYLSSLEQDALGEIGNISFGSSATTLSTLLNQKVEITTPTTTIIKRSMLDKEFQKPHVGVEVEYTEGFNGLNMFILKTKDAAIIADLMLGGQGNPISSELNEIHLSAVQEAMNQMMGTAATSMSTVFNKKIDISPPKISMFNPNENGNEKINDEILVKVSFQLKIGHLIDSKVMQIQPISFAKNLVADLLDPAEPLKDKGHDYLPNNQTEDNALEDNKLLNSNTTGEQPKQLGTRTSPKATVQHATFSNFEDVTLLSKEKRNLDMLLDIPLKVTVELGRTRRTVKEILELSSGAIIELDKLAGEPVDIHVNDKLIAKGEVVVIDENFGVRVTDIVSQSDRLRKLK